MKRLIDLTTSAVALLVLAPIMGLIAVLILLLDPGPVLFIQERVGRDGKMFRVLKFRTMVSAPSAPTQIALRQDRRITPLGHLLRVTKADELPQLINVLRGDMSLVGPRPLIAQQVDLNDPLQREVLSVRPGITSPAAIVFRNEARLLTGPQVQEYVQGVLLPAKQALNLYYVRNRTLLMDTKLILLTLVALFTPISPILVINRKKAFGQIMGEVSGEMPAVGETRAAEIATMRRARRSARRRISLGAALAKRVRRFAPAMVLDLVTIVGTVEAVAALQASDTNSAVRALQQTIEAAVVVGVAFCTLSYLSGLHRCLWRYADVYDFAAIMRLTLVTMGLLGGLDVAQGVLGTTIPGMATREGGVLAGTFVAGLVLCGQKALVRLKSPRAEPVAAAKPTRTLIVGAGQAGATLASRLFINRGLGYEVVAFLDDAPAKWDRRIHGVPIVGGIDMLPDVVVSFAIDLVMIAMPAASPDRIDEAVTACHQAGVQAEVHAGLPRVSPTVSQPRTVRPNGMRA